ncbi:MAG: heparinase II/III family protein [Prevotella sp.]
MRIKTFFLSVVCLASAMTTWADNKEVDQLKKKVDPYLRLVEQQSDWLLSRLQMYWTTHATDVMIEGETFSHPAGDKAPVPTVKFNGMRSHAGTYYAPKLEDVMPYDDNEMGDVHFISRQTGKQELVSTAKTGNAIGSLNRQIMSLARDAALLYRYTADERYARMALGVFDTYMKGIYYRNVPTDLNHGHQQTLVGMQTFEVIHEDIVGEATEIYRLLGDYITADRDIYEGALKKWADNIIDNGVPHNNWNLFQAIFIVKVASVLQPDERYADGKGKQHYLRQVTDVSSIRQWSIRRLADFGYDDTTGIWYESPGYSLTVLRDFTDFANTLDRDHGIDLFRELPVLIKAVEAAVQYLMPNRMAAGFGDTHPNYMSPKAAESIIDYAQRHGDKALVARMEKQKAAIAADAPKEMVEQYVSPSFYAPNVSWVMQRSGMDRNHDLAISLNGSLGNHQHANGISMELYGKGFVLGPDAGIGKALYSGFDYLEYYSQMPAHNTVCVNGVSSYPVMMSQHGFKVEARYPATNDCGNFQPVTFSQVSFIEPETQADQMRTNAIVKTSETGGYNVDIFRSKTERASQFHDYFYHNLGQTMSLTRADGRSLNLQPTDELAFAGGHLYAYSYIYNKESQVTADNVRSTFSITNGPEMTMWFKGSDNQTVFKALSPVNMEYERLGKYIPYDVEKQPVLTFIARRHGEAWDNPFIAVFEPSSKDEPSEIEWIDYFTPANGATGIIVRLKSGDVDYIFSAPKACKMKYEGMKMEGVFGVFRNGKPLLTK